MTRESEFHFSILSVGSNIAPETHIPKALVLLQKQTHVLASSTFYQTTPIGSPGQPAFINGVWLIKTDLDPKAIQENLLHPIEQACARVRQRSVDKYAPRTMDLDLILYDDLAIDGPSLTLPHPDLQRPFVYGPIHELLKDNAPLPTAVTKAWQQWLPVSVEIQTIGRPMPELSRQLRRTLNTSGRPFC